MLLTENFDFPTFGSISRFTCGSPIKEYLKISFYKGVYKSFNQLFPFFNGTKQTLTVPVKDLSLTLAKIGTFVY